MSGRSSNSKHTRHSRPKRVIELRAVADNDQGDDNDDAEGEEEEVETPVPQRRVFTNNTTSVTAIPSRTSSSDDYLAPGESYAYLWTLPIIRKYLTYIGFTSVVLLLLNLAVFLMWFFGKIPGLPSSTMYYGLIMYALFIVTGVLTLRMSCNTSKTMHTITLILVFLAFIMSILIDYLLYCNIVDCLTGSLAPSCGSFNFTRLLLILLSGAITITITVLLLLFAILWVRIGQSFSTLDSLYS